MISNTDLTALKTSPRPAHALAVLGPQALAVLGLQEVPPPTPPPSS